MLHTTVLPLRLSLLAAWCLAGMATLLALPAQGARAVLKYKSEIALTASLQKAWDAFKTFSALHAWHPATEGCKLLVGEDGKPLAVREFQRKGGGGFVINELLICNEQRKRFTSRILKTNLPLANYVSEMWVSPAAGGGR